MYLLNPLDTHFNTYFEEPLGQSFLLIKKQQHSEKTI